MILMNHGALIVALTLLAISVGGWAASLFIPRDGSAVPGLRINPNIAAETWKELRHANTNPVVRWTILGNSWFWLVAVAMVSQFPNYAKDVLGAGNEVVTFFLTVNSVGIGAGSMLAGRLLAGRLTAKLVPISALIMAVSAFDLWWLGGSPATSDYIELAAFLATPSHWRITFDLFAVALGAGLFVVPLYAIMQARSEVSHRSRIVAANNVWNALFMVAAGLGSALMLKLGAGVTDIFLVVALTNLDRRAWRGRGVFGDRLRWRIRRIVYELRVCRAAVPLAIGIGHACRKRCDDRQANYDSGCPGDGIHV